MPAASNGTARLSAAAARRIIGMENAPRWETSYENTKGTLGAARGGSGLAEWQKRGGKLNGR